MATSPLPDAIEAAARALRYIAQGHPVTFSQADDLARVTGYLGLSRPLQDYAPRTQRRYIAAARRGQKAEHARARERESRSSSTRDIWGLTPAQLTRLNKVRTPIIESGVDIREMLDPSVIKEIARMYGFQYLMDVLTQQLDSIKHYTDHNPAPGHARWVSRGELEAAARERMADKFAAISYFPKGTDPYYYYHGTYR
jgi:hypothetical protein